jgi:hypothetical protein
MLENQMDEMAFKMHILADRVVACRNSPGHPMD